MRLRKNITGKKSIPRLTKKTSPKQIQHIEEIDFEIAVALYKVDIKQDLREYKTQDFVASKWVKEALEADSSASTQAQSTYPNQTGASSSSWEGPISDTQAVAVSDYLLNEQETAQDFSEEDEPGRPELGPAWEVAWYHGLHSHQYPRDLGGYGDDGYESYWEAWLDEIQRPPPTNEYYW